MAPTPVVSIVIAARNEGGNVRRTVDSITEHTQGPSYEIVLIDDANTDDAFAFLQTPAYAHRKDILCFRFPEPVGCIRGRHQGVRLARGDYILFLDAHMAVTDGWLERFVRAAARAGALSAVTANVANLDETTWTPAAPYTSYLKIDRTFQFQWDGALHHGHLLPTAGGACVLMRRDLYWRAGGFDLGLRRWGCEFVDLILKVYAVGGKCLFEPDVHVGHLFRKTFPYQMSWLELTYNTLRVGYIHLDGPAFQRFVAGVADMPGFEDAWQLFQSDLAEIDARRQIQRRRAIRAPDWFVRTFLPELAGDDRVRKVGARPAPPCRAVGFWGEAVGSGAIPGPADVSPNAVNLDRVAPERPDVDDRGASWPRRPHGRPLPRPFATGPRVSILIPVRNEGPNLERTLASIRENTRYPDYEIIVVDDASSDGCCSFPASLDDSAVRTRIVRYDVPKGYVAALNDAAHLATGEVLKFLDAHQWVSPNWLINLVAALDRRGGDILVGPVVKPLDPRAWWPAGASSHGFATDRNLSDFWHLGPESIGEDGRVPFLVRHQITLTRRVFFDLGGLSTWFRGHGFDDFDLCWRARARGIPVVVDPTVMVAHLPKARFVNDVTWEDVVYNKLLLAHRHLGDSGEARVRKHLADAPGFEGGLRMFETVHHLIERYPLGPPNVREGRGETGTPGGRRAATG